MKKNFLLLTRRLNVLHLGLFFAYSLHAEGPWDDQDFLVVSENTAYVKAADGNFSDALTAEKNALAAAEDRFGPTHPSLAPILTDLATLCRKMARYSEAESDLRWALALREKNLGLNDQLVAQSLDQLASLDSDLGLFEESEILEKRASKIDIKITPIPDDLAQILIHLGKIDLCLQKYSEALRHLNQGLDLIKNNSSTTGFKTLKLEALWASAQADENLEKNGNASSDLLAAVDQAKQNNPTGLEEGDSLMKLADFNLSHNKQAEAIGDYQSALKIFQHYVGVDSSYVTLPYISRLAMAEQALGDNTDALALWKRALDTSETIYGPSHPQTGVYLLNLADAEKSKGDGKSAFQDLNTALAIFETVYDPGHPLIQEAESRLQKWEGH